MTDIKSIGFVLHKADMAAKNRFTNLLNEYGVTPGQLSVLRAIYHNHMLNASGLPPACIAEQLACDRPTTTGMIDRLEAQGWIIRVQNPEDRRSCLIQLTDKAFSRLPELNKIYEEHQARILDGFTEEEADLFRSYLYRIYSNFNTN